jgi:hypothetical protein
MRAVLTGSGVSTLGAKILPLFKSAIFFENILIKKCFFLCVLCDYIMRVRFLRSLRRVKEKSFRNE